MLLAEHCAVRLQDSTIWRSKQIRLLFFCLSTYIRIWSNICWYDCRWWQSSAVDLSPTFKSLPLPNSWWTVVHTYTYFYCKILSIWLQITPMIDRCGLRHRRHLHQMLHRESFLLHRVWQKYRVILHWVRQLLENDLGACFSFRGQPAAQLCTPLQTQLGTDDLSSTNAKR